MTPKDVFEDQYFNLSCKSFNISEKHINSRNVKYALYKDKKRLTDGHITALASKASSGNYYCEAKAKDITKVSMKLVINVKGKQTIELFNYLVIMSLPYRLYILKIEYSNAITINY